MENHVSGNVAVDTAASQVLALRQCLLAVLIGNPLFTSEEQLRGNHSAYECEDPQRLALWLYNVQREAGRREATHRAQAADLARLLQYPGLDFRVREVLPQVFASGTAAKKIRVVGQAYLIVLERLCRIGQPGEILN